MLEVICIIWLWRTNSSNALKRGQKPTLYRVLTIVLWFGCEILGAIIGGLVHAMTNPYGDPGMSIYLFCLLGAAVGGVISYMIAKNGKQGNYVPEGFVPVQPRPEELSSEIPQYPPQSVLDRIPLPEGILEYPATIRIIREFSDLGADDPVNVYLNGQFIIGLENGKEYRFPTTVEKNTLSIGKAVPSTSDGRYLVQFIAADRGTIEVVVKEGKMIPEGFRNYKPSGS